MEKPVIMNKPIFLNPGEDAAMIYINEAGRDIAIKWGYNVWSIETYLLGRYILVPYSMQELLETAQFSWAKYVIYCGKREDAVRHKKHLEAKALESKQNV